MERRPGSPSEVIALCRERGIQIVDLKFTDLPGTLQHFSIPARALDEGVFRDGIGFDGSSIRGFQHIQESDMLLVPDPSTAFVDPIYRVPTLSVICDVRDPVTGERYWRDPRYVAQKAEAYLRESGIADTAYFGPEVEFFIFDSVRYDQNEHCGYYFVDSEEGAWNSGREGKKPGPPPPLQGGLLPRPAHRQPAGPALPRHPQDDGGGH